METYLGFPPQSLSRPAHLTIGNFDGVHRGHQSLVAQMVHTAHESGNIAGLLTFDPHPLAVLRPDVSLAALTSTEERAEVLAALGLDFVLVLPFSRQVAALSAAAFLEDVTRHIPLRHIWIGPDFALGRGREGNADRLTEIGGELGFGVRVIQPYAWEGQPTRSSRIRALLAEEGNASQAAALLGRPYRVWGAVTEGARRGRTLGFPTANLVLPPGRLVPANGVYACWAWRESTGYPAVVNIGVRPTFDHGHRSIEAYLLDFAGDLYGETMGLSFVARLRGEQRFENVGALVAQIGADVAAARQMLGDPPDHAEAESPALEPGATLWTDLPHMADWAIQVTGDSQRQVFARAAAAMYRLQDADPARPIATARSASLTGDTPAEVLVGWLNHLLLGQEIEGALYTRFELHALSSRGLLGVAYGYHGAPTHTAIKAVTYYDLDVTQATTGWTARITFDV